MKIHDKDYLFFPLYLTYKESVQRWSRGRSQCTLWQNLLQSHVQNGRETRRHTNQVDNVVFAPKADIGTTDINDGEMQLASSNLFTAS